jgi:hypothetical protein
MNIIRKYAHYVVAVIMFLAGIASAIASVRYIVVDAKVSHMLKGMPGDPDNCLSFDAVAASF